MNFVIITGAPFPRGLAPTNRIAAYCRGLVEEGHSVEIICLFPTESRRDPLNTQTEGTYKGIKFLYASGKCVKAPFKFTAWLDKQKGLFRAFKYIRDGHKQQKYDALIITTYSKAAILTSKLLSRVIHVPLILEKGEFPIFIRKPKRFSLSKLISERFIFRLFDGFLVITHALKDYFLRHIDSGKPVGILPMCVETDRFHLDVAPESKQEIAYCGSLDNQKDGIHDLLDAFTQVAAKNPDWTLAVYGGDRAQVEAIRNRVRTTGIEKRVILSGWVESRRIPELLLGASILVLPRPASLQASGGFPTKLGEYLATGHPVIATSVGEIPFYLKNDQNAFIVPPSNPSALAEKIQFVIDHPQIARRVGQNGQQTADHVFHYKTISRQIVDFVKSLREPTDSRG